MIGLTNRKTGKLERIPKRQLELVVGSYGFTSLVFFLPKRTISLFHTVLFHYYFLNSILSLSAIDQWKILPLLGLYLHDIPSILDKTHGTVAVPV